MVRVTDLTNEFLPAFLDMIEKNEGVDKRRAIEKSIKERKAEEEYLVCIDLDTSLPIGYSKTTAMLHGILPRPNDIGYPLEFMSGVWKIIDKFDLDGAQFVPYHNNPYFVSDNENIKISAFKKDGKWLLFVANADGYDQGEVTINGFDGKKIFCESCGKELKAENGKLTLSFNRFAHYFITVE